MPKSRSRPSRAPASPKPTAPTPAASPPAGGGTGSGKGAGKGSGAVLLVVAGLLAVGGAVFFVSAFGDDTTETASTIRYDTPDRTATAAAQGIGQEMAGSVGKPFPYYDSPDEARPFPVTLPPTSYTNETLQHAYALAKEIPEVLVQLPCLCGCHSVSEDHGSLLDCFVDDHAAT